MWKRTEAPHPPVNSRADNNHLQEYHSLGTDQKNHPTDPQNYELKKVITVLVIKLCGTQQTLTNKQMKFLMLRIPTQQQWLFNKVYCLCVCVL